MFRICKNYLLKINGCKIPIFANFEYIYGMWLKKVIFFPIFLSVLAYYSIISYKIEFDLSSQDIFSSF